MTGPETLRRAAALMRERAEGASPSPWTVDGRGERLWGADVVCWHEDGEPGYSGTAVASATDREGACAEPDAEHIASWHPAVALRMADLLSSIAVTWETSPALIKALAIDAARAFLAEAIDA